METHPRAMAFVRRNGTAKDSTLRQVSPAPRLIESVIVEQRSALLGYRWVWRIRTLVLVPAFDGLCDHDPDEDKEANDP